MLTFPITRRKQPQILTDNLLAVGYIWVVMPLNGLQMRQNPILGLSENRFILASVITVLSKAL